MKKAGGRGRVKQKSNMFASSGHRMLYLIYFIVLLERATHMDSTRCEQCALHGTTLWKHNPYLLHKHNRSLLQQWQDLENVLNERIKARMDGCLMSSFRRFDFEMLSAEGEMLLYVREKIRLMQQEEVRRKAKDGSTQ